MKQHITIEQFNELSDKGKKEIKEWWKPEYGDQITMDGLTITVAVEAKAALIELKRRNKLRAFPLLSIGQMIEFLDEKRITQRLVIHIYPSHAGEIWSVQEIPFYNKDNKELCDSLWEAVKEKVEP